jgi:hypothetical protein
MSELSNALRHRLAAREKLAITGSQGGVSENGGSQSGVSQSNALQVHPDPDLLTAYLEQLLPAAERTQVVQHLAACRQCRDVLALSLPEQSAGEGRIAVLALPDRRGWWARLFTKPVLGLAASVAGLALVAILMIELPQQKKAVAPPPLSAANENSPQGQPAGPEREAAQPGVTPSGSVSTVAPAELHDKAASNKASGGRSSAEEVASAGARAKTTFSPVAGPYVNTSMFDNSFSTNGNTFTSSADLPSAPAPQVTDFQTALRQNTLQPEPGQLSRADVPYEVPSSKPMHILTPPSSSHFPGFATMTSLEKTLGRDARQLFKKPVPPMSAYGVAGTAMFNPARGLAAAPPVAAAAPAAEKDATELEQSSGFTRRALSGAGMSSLNITTWKVSDSKLLRLESSGAWVEAQTDQGIDFSVVSNHGPDVWAGGSNASLIHSHNGGATWERITLGASASGTITSIEINGSQVHVKSSSGQGWSSLDGGKIWSLEE